MHLPRAVRGDGLAVALGGRPRGREPLRVGSVVQSGEKRREETPRRGASARSGSRSRRLDASSKRRARPLGRMRHPRETQRVAEEALRARKGASRTCCGTFAQPWLITLDSQTTRDGGTRVPPRSCASRSAGDEARRDRVATVFYRRSRTARGTLGSRARASAAKRIERICTLRLNAHIRSIFVFPLAIPHASRAATFAAPHSARARVRRRVRVVRSTANVAVAQATAPRARTALSVSRESSVTRGQKHGAACHGRPAGDEPGPERARGRARVLRVASGGEGEGQTVLPRGAHARHATRDRPRTRPPRTRCRR